MQKMIDPKEKINLLYVSQLAFDQMQRIPTVDAEVVVRCKDCKHMIRKLGACYCYAWGHFNGAGEDGFCNYGEQKERERE